LTYNGETGPDFCTREGGVWSISKDICTAASTVGAINNGAVSEDDVNKDLSTNTATNGASGYTVVVLVITDAGADSQGNAHFKTFIDVTGDAQPGAADQEKICAAVSSSLATHLGVSADAIQCSLTIQNKKRATTYSYLADMTVYGSSNIGTGNGVEAVVPVVAVALMAIAELAKFIAC